MSKFLVIGQGSMGKRRVRCLLANGVAAERIVVFDTRNDRLKESVEKYQITASSDFALALKDPDLTAVLVSVPGFLHMEYCLAAARAGKHWFCEVPLAIHLDGLDELRGLTCAKSLVAAPGCQLLFHPLGRAFKAWSESPEGHPILAASYTMGTYLPDWHPHEDYRKFYASNKSMGGGNLDIIAQELTWIRCAITQPMVAVSCRTSKTSALELSKGTPDHHEIVVEFADGLMLSMHFDLLDRSHERVARFITDHSTLKWSNLDAGLQIYDYTEKTWKREPQPGGYDYEWCYQEEIGQFLRCIEKREPWPIAIETAEEIVRFLLAIEKSDNTKRIIYLADV
jgi:predicted dehydrogenase